MSISYNYDTSVVIMGSIVQRKTGGSDKVKPSGLVAASIPALLAEKRCTNVVDKVEALLVAQKWARRLPAIKRWERFAKCDLMIRNVKNFIIFKLSLF